MILMAEVIIFLFLNYDYIDFSSKKCKIHEYDGEQ